MKKIAEKMFPIGIRIELKKEALWRQYSIVLYRKSNLS